MGCAVHGDLAAHLNSEEALKMSICTWTHLWAILISLGRGWRQHLKKPTECSSYAARAGTLSHPALLYLHCAQEPPGSRGVGEMGRGQCRFSLQRSGFDPPSGDADVALEAATLRSDSGPASDLISSPLTLCSSRPGLLGIPEHSRFSPFSGSLHTLYLEHSFPRWPHGLLPHHSGLCSNAHLLARACHVHLTICHKITPLPP